MTTKIPGAKNKVPKIWAESISHFDERELATEKINHENCLYDLKKSLQEIMKGNCEGGGAGGKE